MYRGEEGEEEPEWVKNEKEQFSLYRDKDGDGFLNADEVCHFFYHSSLRIKIYIRYIEKLHLPDLQLD